MTPGPLTRPRLAILGLLVTLAAAPRALAQEQEEALTLEQCVALALEHNPAVTIERERLRQSEEDYVVARAALLPKLTGSASYNRLDPGRLNPAGFASATAPTLFVEEAFAGLRLRQLVIDGSSWLTLRAAGQGVDAQRSGVVASQAETVFAVTLAHTRLVEAQNMVTVAQGAVDRQLAFEGLTEFLFTAGKISHLDKLGAELQRRDAERALVVAREAAALAQALLRRTLGVTTDRPVLATGELRRPLDPSPAEESVLASAVSNNPQLQRLAAQARQLDAAVWAARGLHFPEVSLQGSYGYRLRDVGGGAGEYTAGVFLDVPLFSGLATGALVRRAEARRRELEASRQAFEADLLGASPQKVRLVRGATRGSRATWPRAAGPRAVPDARVAPRARRLHQPRDLQAQHERDPGHHRGAPSSRHSRVRDRGLVRAHPRAPRRALALRLSGGRRADQQPRRAGVARFRAVAQDVAGKSERARRTLRRQSQICHPHLPHAASPCLELPRRRHSGGAQHALIPFAAPRPVNAYTEAVP